MSREDDLKKYLAKRERKQNRKHVVEREENQPAPVNGKRDPESFRTFFELSDGRSRWIVTAFIAVGVCIGIAVFLNYMSIERPSIFFIVLGVFVMINLLFFGGLNSRHKEYKRFASGKDSGVTGWNQFIAGRSDGFWDGGSYAHVSIKFDQDHKVSDLEKQALAAFHQTWINDWGYRYKDQGKWTYGAPKEFNRIGADRLEGHVSISNGVPFMMDQLMNKLPELLKLLTPGSLQITISTAGSDLSTSIDDSEEREEERRSDQRHREMMSRED